MRQTGSYSNNELYTSVYSHANSVFWLTIIQTHCRYSISAKKKKQKTLDSLQTVTNYETIRVADREQETL